MSDILTKWLNDNVKLSTHVSNDNADHIFRNGYLFGELVSKLIDNDSILQMNNHEFVEKLNALNAALPASSNQLFLKNSIPQAIIQNYMALEKIMSIRLGSRLTPALVMDVIKGVEGAAFKLIYQIKSAYENASNMAKTDGRMPEFMDEAEKRLYIRKDFEHFSSILKMQVKRYAKKLLDNSPIKRHFDIPEIVRVEKDFGDVLSNDQGQKIGRKALHAYELAFEQRSIKRCEKILRQVYKNQNLKQDELFGKRFEKILLKVPLTETCLMKSFRKNADELENIIVNENIQKVQMENVLAKKNGIEIHRQELESENNQNAEMAELEIFTKEVAELDEDYAIIEHAQNEKFCRFLAEQIVENSFKVQFNKVVAMGEPVYQTESHFRKLQFELGYKIADSFNPIDSIEGQEIHEKLCSFVLSQYLAGAVPWFETSTIVENSKDQVQNRLKEVISEIFPQTISCMIASMTNEYQKPPNHKLGKNNIIVLYCAQSTLEKAKCQIDTAPGMIFLQSEELLKEYLALSSIDNIQDVAVPLNSGQEVDDAFLSKLFAEKIMRECHKNTQDKKKINQTFVMVNFPSNKNQASLFEAFFGSSKIVDNPQPGILKRFSFGAHKIENNISLLYPNITMHTPSAPNRSIIRAIYAFSSEFYGQVLAQKQLGFFPSSFFDKDFKEKFEISNYKRILVEMKEFYDSFCDITVFHTLEEALWTDEWLKLTQTEKKVQKQSLNIKEPEKESLLSYKEHVSFHLSNSWLNLERTFVERLHVLFSHVHFNYEEIDKYFYSVKYDFFSTLNQPNNLQTLLNNFLLTFNQVDQDMRFDSDVKNELHLRLLQLVDQMTLESNRIVSETEEILQSYFDDCWLEERLCALANIHLQMIKAEFDRFVSCQRILQDYYKDVNSRTSDVNQMDFVPLKTTKVAENFSSLTKVWKTQYLNRIDSAWFNKPAKFSSGTFKRASSSGTNRTNKPTDLDIPYIEEIQSSIDQSLKSLGVSENVAKDSKKKTTAADVGSEVPLELQQALDQENLLLKDRLKRIKSHYFEMVKLLRNKYYSFFTMTEDEVSNATIQLSNMILTVFSYIGSCIESDVGMPNTFTVKDKIVTVNFGELICPPFERKPEERKIRDEKHLEFEIEQRNLLATHLSRLNSTLVLPIKLERDRVKRFEHLSSIKNAIP